ncbi:MAG: sugar transferase [Verrucomicrobiota bacterium]
MTSLILPSLLSSKAGATRLDKANGSLKRLVDIVGGLAGLVISAPLMAVCAAIIYRESPGAVVYKQIRTGRDGQDFTIFKLRTMRLDAETDGKVGWTVENDPRRLKIGEFMRSYNIDEVPQFWNVLKGDMSLVGPRPERPEHIVRLRDEIPQYDERHAVKPGLTGWAQVNGWRGNTDLNERVKCDLDYIENASIVWDLKIMVKTFFNRQNAY